MRVGRLKSPVAQETLGIVLATGAGDMVLDVAVVGKHCPHRLSFEPTMADLIDAGERGLEQLRAMSNWAITAGDYHWLMPESAAEWLVPVQPSKCIAAGRNFRKHAEEGANYLAKHGISSGNSSSIPAAFAKFASTMVPTRSKVVRPSNVQELDYEIEVAAVVGKRMQAVSERDAMAGVFGYTILNDLSAREWLRQELGQQMILMGKNFPGFGPLGPWIVTADEVPDPSALELELTVNGEVRQRGSTADMIFPFPELLAYWSRTQLMPGDLVTSGTPSGCAVGRPDPAAFFLKPGDRVRASVSSIGALWTQIA